jgi:hypothetical protein
MNKVILNRVLPFAIALFASAVAGAQSQMLRLPQAQMPVAQVLSRIHSQTGLGAAYSTSLIDPDRLVIFPSLSMTVDEAVKTIASGTGATYAYENQVILFSKAPELPREIRPAVRQSAPQPAPVRSAPQVTQPAPVIQQTAPVVPVAPMPLVEPVSKYRPMSLYAENQGRLPGIAVKTNLLYGLGALTPNLSFEFGLGPRTTLEAGVSYNPWNLKGSLESNKKLVHLIVKPEFRYWLCERFTGHFFGAHVIYGRYNIGTHEVPMLFEKEFRYDGHAAGGGVTYGYNLPIAKRLNAEFAVGVGALWLTYDRFDCAACNRDAIPETRTYFGPTNASVSLVFLIK